MGSKRHIERQLKELETQLKLIYDLKTKAKHLPLFPPLQAGLTEAAAPTMYDPKT